MTKDICNELRTKKDVGVTFIYLSHVQALASPFPRISNDSQPTSIDILSNNVCTSLMLYKYNKGWHKRG